MKLRSWYVAWCISPACPDQAGLVGAIHPALKKAQWASIVQGKEWERITITMSAEPLRVPFGSDLLVSSQVWASRHIADRDVTNLRQWASDWLRSTAYNDEPHRDAVLNHVLQSSQTIHLTSVLATRPARVARVCEQIVGYLCRTLNGIIQVHQEGFFGATGESLVPKNDRHRLKTI